MRLSNEQDQELNRILDKISSQGIESLTRKKLFRWWIWNWYWIWWHLRWFRFCRIDYEGNYTEANKENYLFKVFEDKEQLSYGSVGVVVLEKSGKYIIDSCFWWNFPELKDIGLEDLSEGVLNILVIYLRKNLSIS
jgi:hypothetical protein